MTVETLEYLEQVLSGLRARYAAGDKTVESKLRAVSIKVDQLKLQKDLVKSSESKVSKTQQLVNVLKRKSCCR